MIAALQGVTVVEVGALLPVPATGANLRRLGADVVKIEPPGGDPARSYAGGWLQSLYGDGKRCLELDLASAEGMGRAAALVGAADVVLVGYRPAAARRLGVDATTVTQANPTAIHCSIVGFSSGGRDADRPAHDLSFLARCGALVEPATVSAESDPAPRRPAMPVVDLAGAAVATQAVLAGLLARERTGRGEAFEVVLDDVAVAWMAPRLGPAVDPALPPALDPANDVFRCADGRWLALAAIEPRFWAALCDCLAEVGELEADLRELASADRIERRRDLRRLLTALLAARPAAHWLEALARRGVPVEEVVDADAVVAARGRDLGTWRRLAVPLPAGRAS